MKLPNTPIEELQQQAKELIASINGLSAWTGKTTESQILDDILESSKNRIEGAVENVKVAFQYYNKHTSNISPNKKTPKI